MISLSVQPVFLNDLLVTAVNGIYEKARKKNIEIALQEIENISLQLDEHWTSEAIINVLDNAVKYSPEYSHIIQESEYNKIFLRFYRSNEPAIKKIEGSGVGLYLTRMILERQGGTISVKSAPGKGSTFILQFKN